MDATAIAAPTALLRRGIDLGMGIPVVTSSRHGARGRSEVRRFGGGSGADGVRGRVGTRRARPGDPVLCVEGPKVFGSGDLPRWTGHGRRRAGRATSSYLRIPDGMDDEAALPRPTTSPPGGQVAAADVPPGGTVVVLGLGAVGLCAVGSALALGVARVLAWTRDRRRDLRGGLRGRAGRGADRRGRARRDRRPGADAVIDAVAHDATLDDGSACVRAGGTVSVIGVDDLQPYPLPALTTLFSRITIR